MLKKNPVTKTETRSKKRLEDIEGLEDVMTVFGDTCAMVGSEAIFRVMENEGDELLDKMSGKAYQFPSEFSPEDTSRLIQRIKYRFKKGYWDL